MAVRGTPCSRLPLNITTMTTDPHHFFGPAQDANLNPQEKATGWHALQARMQEHRSLQGEASAEELQEMESFFAPCAAVCLNAEEKTAVRSLLQEEAEAMAFFAPVQSLSLDANERASILRSIQSSASVEDVEVDREHHSFFDILASLFSARLLAPGMAAVILISLGAGISYAAESALPGEFLYAIKKVNEQIHVGLQFSHESKAEVETERLGRRLQEANALKSAERMTDAASSTLDHEFQLARRRAVLQIQLLEQEGNSIAAERIKDRLSAYEEGFRVILGVRIGEEEKTDAASGSSSSDSNATASSPSSVSSSSQNSSPQTSSSSQGTDSSASTGSRIRIDVDTEADIESHLNVDVQVSADSGNDIRVDDDILEGASASVRAKVDEILDSLNRKDL